MIEQAMIFALGCLAAGLLMLLLLPAVWRRAVRLSSRRLAMQVPLSLDEIVAERDQLRAAFAIEQRRLEQKAESLGEARAQDMAELGRRAIKLNGQEQAIAAQRLDIAALQQRAETTRLELLQVQGEVGSLHTALFDADGLRERREGQLRASQDAYQLLQIGSGQQQVTISDLETRLSVTEMSLDAHVWQLAEGHRMLGQRNEEVETLVSERSHARAQVVALMQRRDGLQGDLAALGEQRDALGEALAKAQAEAVATSRENARRAQSIAAYEQQVQDMGARSKAMQERNERALQQAYASERDMAHRLESIRSEKAVANGALLAARDERARLQRELALVQANAAHEVTRAAPGNAATGAADSDAADSDADLRRAITDLAERLLRRDDPVAQALPVEPVVKQPRLRGQPKRPVDKVTASADPASA